MTDQASRRQRAEISSCATLRTGFPAFAWLSVTASLRRAQTRIHVHTVNTHRRDIPAVKGTKHGG